VIRRPSRGCRGHRASLLEFVDRPDRLPATSAALDHLERCAPCRDELAEVAQVVTALRRIGRELETVDAPGGAWLDIRQRITRPAETWRWRTTLGTMMVSAMLVAVVVGRGELTVEPQQQRSFVADPAEDPGNRLIEDTYLASRRADVHGPIDESPVAGRSLPLLRTEAVAFRKEVKAAGPRPRLI
jgi:hypothetical protein